jgi:cell division protein FtsL
MVELPITVPSNRFLTPQRDRRWPHVLSAVLLVAVAVLIVLFLMGWPRLRSTSIHYELIQLRAEVEELERQEHRLQIELERERSPARLGRRAAELGLSPPDPTALAQIQAQEGGR